MSDLNPGLTRRSALISAAVYLLLVRPANSAEEQIVTVHKDPSCRCCSGWIQHLQKSGFTTKIADTADIGAVKLQFGVPADLAACHTAQVAGYVIEGHVPAIAIKRFLAEKPKATGLAVAGMPAGAPGMEGGKPEPYEVVLFGPTERRIYIHFIGEQPH